MFALNVTMTMSFDLMTSLSIRGHQFVVIS